MAGYWNNPEATAETLRGGWLHTGDVGSFDDDGYLTLRDRSKDLIISGGMNIYPREVEEALLRHPGVERRLGGRAGPTPSGARPSWPSWWRPRAPPRRRPTISTSACLDSIARFKRPKEYRFVDSLPTNNYGKVLKRELRERLQAETARLTVMWVPTPTTLSSSSVPSIASVSRRASTRPRPAPPSRPASAPRRSNGTNSRASSSAGIPGP